jgi:protein-L-isoaspartate(D-aspartate) O-methyltransferase
VSTEAHKIRLIMSLRRAGVTDARVLGALERVPREFFVPAAFQDQAWEDVALPIDHEQTISQPLVVAMMTQALDVHDRHRVLEIGTGSGYQAAVLSKLCRRLYTIERIKPLLLTAEERFRALKINNITTRLGDGSKGWPETTPFERIMVTAAGGEEPPGALLAQLATGGVMIIPLGGEYGEQWVCRLTRTEDGSIRREALWPVRFVPLVSDPPAASKRGREA